MFTHVPAHCANQCSLYVFLLASHLLAFLLSPNLIFFIALYSKPPNVAGVYRFDYTAEDLDKAAALIVGQA